ncbi:MAG: DUF2868 domain-containing protein [Thermodesulfobacteriota bacterium]
MAERWQIKDVIDLEYFLDAFRNRPQRQEAAEDAPALDRETYLSYTGAHTPPFGRSELIRYWVEARRAHAIRQTDDAGLLPGRIYSESMRLLRFISAGLAAVAGAGLTWRLFSYQGQQPINVFTCLWVLLAPQLLLLLALAGVSAARRVRLMHSSALIYPLLSRGLRAFSRWIQTGADHRPGAEKRNRIRAALGKIGQTRRLYGSLFLWPVFLTAQVIGIFFNIGILAAMLLRVTITDLAFGWQSTLQPDAETVYRIVDAISLPWSWFSAPPAAHPTMEQIAGSQMVLKEGIYHMATPDLVAWWPFLCFAILFYGLLPRAMLLAFGLWRQRRALDRLDFNHAACDRLLQRMQTPQIDTASRPYTGAPVAHDRNAPPADAAPVRPAATANELPPATVLIEADIRDNCTDSELAGRIEIDLGMSTAEIISVEIDIDQDTEQLLRAQSQQEETNAAYRIVIVMEAWQPPIRETLNWLRGMRRRLAQNTGMVIALVGKPSKDTIFTPPADADHFIWQQAIEAIGDAYLRVERLGD